MDKISSANALQQDIDSCSKAFDDKIKGVGGKRAVMCCPGGCINGGGQPFVKPSLLSDGDESILDTYRQKRADILYSIDDKKSVRQSHNNPDIIRLYKDYLGSYGSEKAEELLHTSYVKDREQFPKK